MSRKSIARLQTVDQKGSWQNDGRVSVDLTMVLTLLVVGFNIGAVMTMCAAFVLLPQFLNDFEIQRASSADEDQQAAVIMVTPTPRPQSSASPSPTMPLASPTMVSSATPLDTPTTSPSDTPPATNTPPIVISIDQASNSNSRASTPTSPPPTSPPPNQFRLEGLTFHRQGWNNCGPANLAMGLSYYGWDGDQNDTATFLKPDREDKNVTPDQMVEYVQRYTNLNAIWRMAGDIDTLRWLIANEFVVIVESGYDPRNGEGWYGHYETVVAYDDAAQRITVYDSYLGTSANPAVTRSYEAFDRDWQSFNRNYIVIYSPGREAELQAFLGDNWIVSNNRRHAATIAQQEVNADPDNGYAWFNLGTSLTSLGRYDDAVVAYQRAFEEDLPYRMLWYQFGPYEALLQTSRLDDVLRLANESLGTTIYVEETYYFKGRVFEIRGNYEAAIEQYTLALDLNPNYSQAQTALDRVSS